MEPGSSEFVETLPRETSNRFRQRLAQIGQSLRLSRLQGKLIIPYVLLTLMLAMVGTYVVTRLVTSSLRERFVNQLYEAARVSSDGFVRQEKFHLEQLRLMAFADGVAQALAIRDQNALEELLLPLVMNSEIQILSVIDLDGGEMLSFGLDPVSRQYVISHGSDFSVHPLVKNILTGHADEFGDKFAGFMDTGDGLALCASAPVRTGEAQLVGALLICSRMDALLTEIKSQALTDIVIVDDDFELMGNTLVEPDEGYDGVIEAARFLTDQDRVSTVDIQLYERDFQIHYSPLVIRQEQAGWLGVLLPSSYVTTAEATNRNMFSLFFALGTIAIALLGYALAQSIARPILRLRSMSQAVAAGDLGQNINLHRADEIGELAVAFDQMTLKLRARTEEAARLYAETVQRNDELAEINARLQATQLQLVQSEKLAAIGQLTAGIVHDVKNPIGAIKGLAELTHI